MARRLLELSLVLAVALSASGCDLVVGIFEAGFWVGIIVVIALVALVAWAVSKMTGRKEP